MVNRKTAAATSDNGGSSGPKRSTKRVGLGRGLGALIPSGQEEQIPQSSSPTDILFPQRRQPEGTVSSEQPQALPRGGSAKDLLSPRQKRVPAETIVSRETIAQKEPSKNVSRETMPDSGSTDDLVQVPGASFGSLPLEMIIANTRQPRQIFEQTDLDELAASIAEVGVLQPIVVRPVDSDQNNHPALRAALEDNPQARYELIMGERRLRASQIAGVAVIPAIVRHTEDEDLLRDALLENLHRVQLNPLEEAAAYEQLLEDFSCTQEELARRVARSRPQIANTLRLLRLPPSVQAQVAATVLSAGHARALLGLDSSAQMEALAKRIVAEGLSVRTTEELVRFGRNPDTEAKKKKMTSPPSELAIQVMGQVSDYLDTQVTVTQGKSKGKIIIDFADAEDLRRISAILAKS